MSNGVSQYGSIYDWVDDYISEQSGNVDEAFSDQEVEGSITPTTYRPTESYTEGMDEETGMNKSIDNVAHQDKWLWNLYQQATATTEEPIAFDDFKKQYGYLLDPYDSTKEDLRQDKFDLKVKSLERLYNIAEEHSADDLALIRKYKGIDDSDGFESLTELSIRHQKETAKVDNQINRLNKIAKGIAYNQKKSQIGDKNLLNTLKSGDQEEVIEGLNETFWSDMKVVRSKYDQERLNRNQAIEKLVLKSGRDIEDAEFKARTGLEKLLTKTEAKVQNEALSLLQDKVKLREEYDDELWTTVGEIAERDGLIKGECSGCVWTYQSTGSRRRGANNANTQCRNNEGACPDHCCGPRPTKEEQQEIVKCYNDDFTDDNLLIYGEGCPGDDEYGKDPYANDPDRP